MVWYGHVNAGPLNPLVIALKSGQQQRHVLGGELVTLAVRNARGRDGILGPTRVDAHDTKPLPPYRELTTEVIWR